MSARGAVVADGVWKSFRRGPRDDTIRGALAAAGRRFWRRTSRAADAAGPGTEAGEFWALRDVSFEVAPGQVLGIVGANGAGKSTVLKLLSRIIAPTRGRVEVRGRVASLVELAAGFHPDLTGRENVYLQGAIFGMTRRDVAQRFDEIVAFADIAGFIDTPVKRYSSGMHARLGFSVAAHLSPDVLLVDEVLAVGDHRFQRRAFQRLQEVVATGAAVVVVSHQLERVVQLADEGILLADGAVVMRGSPAACVQAYIDGASDTSAGAPPSPYELTALTTTAASAIRAGDRLPLVLTATATGLEGAGAAIVGVRVWRLPEERVVSATNARAAGIALPTTGTFRLHVTLQMNLGPGLYRVQGVVWRDGDAREWRRGPSLVVRVEESPVNFGTVFLDPTMHLDVG
ncbi:MAG TPA: ABC transporter ATP-binding protein [Gemmatimonadaceae bacterium]|nr:ABC transporter ATP-binding protein [Gemmatimonadaceae bacterium]